MVKTGATAKSADKRANKTRNRDYAKHIARAGALCKSRIHFGFDFTASQAIPLAWVLRGSYLPSSMTGGRTLRRAPRNGASDRRLSATIASSFGPIGRYHRISDGAPATGSSSKANRAASLGRAAVLTLAPPL